MRPRIGIATSMLLIGASRAVAANCDGDINALDVERNKVVLDSLAAVFQPTREDSARLLVYRVLRQTLLSMRPSVDSSLSAETIRCSFSRQPRSFTPDLCINLENRRVLLEVWSTVEPLEDEAGSFQLRLQLASYPLCNLDALPGGLQRGFYERTVEFAPGDTVATVEQRLEAASLFRGFAYLSLGVLAMKDRAFDQSIRCLNQAGCFLESLGDESLKGVVDSVRANAIAEAKKPQSGSVFAELDLSPPEACQ